MAEGGYVLDTSFKASGDLSSYQYHAMTLSAANTAGLCGANGVAVGILQNKPDAAGEPAVVRVIGESKMVAGEAIDIGTMITSKSDGHGEEADANAEFCYAMALEAATLDGDIISVMLMHADAYATDATAPTP